MSALGSQDPFLTMCLAVILFGCALLLRLPDEQGEKPKGRNLEREHALGAHRETPAWGCKICSANQ